MKHCKEAGHRKSKVGGDDTTYYGFIAYKFNPFEN